MINKIFQKLKNWEVNRFNRLNTSFNNRYHLEEDKLKVLYISDNTFNLNSTFRYRVYNIFEYSKFIDWFNCSYAFIQEKEQFISDVDKFDILILNRMPFSEELVNIIEIAKSKNIPVGYDIDDLIFDSKYLKLIIEHNGGSEDKKNANRWTEIVSKTEMIADLADFFITTNNFLEKKLIEKFNKKVFVFPNTLNSLQYTYIKKFRESNKSNKIILGYFSGSNTHNADFQIIKNDIIRIFNKYDNVMLLIAGFLEFGEDFKQFDNRIIRMPHTNFIEMLGNLNMVDILLNPLVNNIFNNCKSELKYFEAGLLGIPGIFSKTYIYNEIIKDGVNGLLVDDDKWFASISILIEDPHLRNALGSSAKVHSIENYYGKSVILKIETLFSKLKKEFNL